MLNNSAKIGGVSECNQHPLTPNHNPAIGGRTAMADAYFTEEQWKAIPGFEGLYEASTHGRIRSLRIINHHCNALRSTPKPKVTVTGPNGYRRALLSKADKRLCRSVHRLVLLAFVGPPPDGHEAMHLDGDRQNNHLSNLAWGTKKENSSHKVRHGTSQIGERNGQATLTADLVRQIRWGCATGLKGSEIAANFGVGYGAVMAVITGKTWRHVK